jgi:hypothetical protein
MTTSSKKQQEKLHETIKELKKLPANKICADCSEKVRPCYYLQFRLVSILFPFSLVFQGPQNIVIGLNIFVCMTCSGIQYDSFFLSSLSVFDPNLVSSAFCSRSYGHRVKTVSMSDFTQAEVDALAATGNEYARKVYMGKWTSQEFPEPDASQTQRLNDFISSSCFFVFLLTSHSRFSSLSSLSLSPSF